MPVTTSVQLLLQ